MRLFLPTLFFEQFDNAGSRIPADMQFVDWKELETRGKIADAVVVAVLVGPPILSLTHFRFDSKIKF